MENSESLNVAIENISLLFLVSFYKYLRMDHTMYGYGGVIMCLSYMRSRTVFSRVHATLLSTMSVFSVRRSDGRFLRYRTCPNAWVSLFITAPLHPHATLVSLFS